MSTRPVLPRLPRRPPPPARPRRAPSEPSASRTIPIRPEDIIEELAR
ncbi:MAG: hypothetical protein IPL61_30430 [Myxococcales bacterium]|nr:hypothetical protein [Myxococcales bacterium]MBK9035526.1 hypothetical protein [Myxococcales bacterium]